MSMKKKILKMSKKKIFFFFLISAKPAFSLYCSNSNLVPYSIDEKRNLHDVGTALDIKKRYDTGT
jgi:hypothetical protein